MPVLVGSRGLPAGPLAARGLDPRDAQQLAHRVRRLGSVREPAARPVLVEDDRGRLRACVVVADRLDHAPIPRGALVVDDYAPQWILLTAHSREPQPDRHLFLTARSLIAMQLRRSTRLA